MTDLPCTCPTETYVWTETATASRNGSSSVVEADAEQAAKDLAETMKAEVANSMNEWLKGLHCAAGCDIGVIYIGPPGATYSEHIRTNHGPRFEILGYDVTATVSGRLSVDCHRPVAGKVGHVTGAGLPMLEEFMKRAGFKPNPKAAKPPTSHAGAHPPPGTVIVG